jgi:dienelactone hydrolase
MLMRLLAVVLLLVATASAQPAPVIETRVLPITYQSGPATRPTDSVIGECFLAWDASVRTPRPGVLVFPEWWGLTEYAKARARQLAELGYVALAVDVYGNGQTTEDAGQAAQLANGFKSNRALLRQRGIDAMSTLRRLNEVDPKRTAAIGYCFGGTAALELARSGADVRAVVSFHGDLSTPTAADARNIRASILVLHGALDPYVPAKAVEAFEAEMASARVDYLLISYANAVHSFTNPAAGADASKGAAYNRLADERSWGHMRLFLEERLLRAGQP